MIVAAGTLLSAQAQFRTGTELVSVYTTVQEPSGRLVPDLRREDFIVTDNGKVQPITFFSNEISPFSVVIMLDRSGSMLQHRVTVQDAAAAFVSQMLPGDRARIGSIGTRISISPPEFTGNRLALLETLSQPLGGGASPIWLSVDQSITALHGLSGRRVILLFSDGDDEPADTNPRTPFKALYDRVKRSGVMVYSVGFASTQTENGRIKIKAPDKKLRELAVVSGGGYFEIRDTADLSRLFSRVIEELHRQYWIGFEPPKRDGKFHDIKVRVNKPGLIARARQSYLAPPPQ
jgi:VWFA-related protein